MSLGLQIRDAAGVLTFDSTAALGGHLVDVVHVPSTAQVQRSYPEFPGRAAFVLDLGGSPFNGLGVFAVTIDYALGYPRVTFPLFIADWMVFIE